AQAIMIFPGLASASRHWVSNALAPGNDSLSLRNRAHSVALSPEAGAGDGTVTACAATVGAMVLAV
ncbi:MAG: hypothetical protein ACK462_08835, partial [Planctomyces sp.]